jgi:epoxyqueuosine reductase
MRKDLPANTELEARAQDLTLRALLHMDQEHYENRVWPHFFYIPRSRIDRWQMNAARAMGNTGDPAYVPDLEEALESSPYPNVRAMSAWALGRLGGPRARAVLERRKGAESGLVAEEIVRALSA